MSHRIRIDPSTRVPFEDDAREVTSPLDELTALRRTIEARPSRYVELAARTSFSFLSGATPPEAMVVRAAELGYDAIAIVDRDGIYGIVRACEEAAKHGVRVIVGCELTLEREGLEGVPDVPGKPNTLTVLVEDHIGYTNLCKILTESHRRHPRSIPTKRADNLDEEDLPRNTFAGVPLSYVCAHSAGLWALADAALFFSTLTPATPTPTTDRGDANDDDDDDDDGNTSARPSTSAAIAEFVRAFGKRLSISVHLHKDGEDRARVSRVETAARIYGLPICATNRVLFARPCDKPLLDVLYCIREGKTLDEAGRDLAPNSEAHLKSEEEIFRLFSLHPEWALRSRFIADRCRFSIKELAYRFPYEISDLVHRDFREPAGEGASTAQAPTPALREQESADEALRRLTYDGARTRYGASVPEKVHAQIEKELALIEKLEVAPYFLSVRAVVDMARRRDILCQGRGSAANSAVCFCLGITAVDPARSNMLFERFLSAERREPPDIDVDFEHERREEVIQEIYETYGRDRAAMVCEVISYRSKSALREVGKVFGFSLEQVDRLAGVVSWWDGMGAASESRLRAIGFSADDPRVRQTLVMAKAIQGFPRHLSIHVGGFVLSAAPLVEVAPIEPATMQGRTIIPWDKDDIDTLGFFKIDVLGLGMLTAIRKCLDLVRDVAAQPVPVEDGAGVEEAEEANAYASRGVLEGTAIERLAKIPAEDPAVYDALCNADTVGVFQIESRAQMAMLPRLRPRTFYDLVIEVAIVRPGPIQGGMVHPYLRRRTGEEKSDPPHPLLRPILERTLGVPLFQEQVMQIAIVGAGYTGGEADRLRRDMAAWRKTGSLEKHRGRLLDGFRERGIPEAFGERLFQQIHGFAEYGFPESHSASFALLVYASSWLKVHYPAELAAALINSQPMGFYSPSTLLQDAQRHGVTLLPIDANTSDWDCLCVRNRAGAATKASAPTSIRLGLRLIQGFGEAAGRRVERARAERPFTSVDDVVARAQLNKKEAMALAESGALDPLAFAGAGGMSKASGGMLDLNVTWLDDVTPDDVTPDDVTPDDVTPDDVTPDATNPADDAHAHASASATHANATHANATHASASATHASANATTHANATHASASATHASANAATHAGATHASTARRAAIWHVVAPRSTELYEGTISNAPAPKLAPMTRAEQLVLDYERTGVSIADHPLKLLRASFPKRFKTSRDVMSLPSGTRVSAAGLVTCRQRPGTASGVVFITLEDEYGFMNLVVWSRVFEAFRHVATTARLLVVHGRIERSDEAKASGSRSEPNADAPQSVVHLIADRLERLDEKMPRLASMSRDFH